MTTRIIVAIAATIIAGVTILSSTSQAATPNMRVAGEATAVQGQKPGSAGGQTVRVNRDTGTPAKDHSFDVRPAPRLDPVKR